MPLIQEEWRAIKALRDAMVELRDFCESQKRFDGCCGDPDAECPISMGEWWGSKENEALKDVSAILFPDAR